MNRLIARWSVVAVALLLTSQASADDAPKNVMTSVRFLTELNIAELTLDVKPFTAWTKPVIQSLESKFKNETIKRVVVVQVTLHPKAPAEVAIVGTPALSDDETKSLLKVADASKAPHSKVTDCTFQIVALINEAEYKGNDALLPRLQTPDEQKAAVFEAADTAERVQLMRTWARTEALPILAAIASSAEPKYEGVVNLGKSITGDDPKRPLDITALTDRSPHYWRAMLEMAPGIPTVPAIRVALHAANGELDQARRVAEMARFFDARKSGASRILGDFERMNGVFSKGLNDKIKEGIKLHDKNEFAEALTVYDDVLKAYPKSAWANFERYQTRLMIAGDQPEAVIAEWPKTKAAILASDPLYASMAVAKGLAEQRMLIRRMQISELFQDRSKSKEDMLAYADIALDLDVPGFAAILYWNSVAFTNPNEAELNTLVESFLYCLDKLGVKSIHENFKGDHAAEFAKIKESQAKRFHDIDVKLGAAK